MNQKNELASRLSRGEYEIDPKRVAEAILRQRGRGLLMLVPTGLEDEPVGRPEGDAGAGFSAA